MKKIEEFREAVATSSENSITGEVGADCKDDIMQWWYGTIIQAVTQTVGRLSWLNEKVRNYHVDGLQDGLNDALDRLLGGKKNDLSSVRKS